LVESPLELEDEWYLVIHHVELGIAVAGRSTKPDPVTIAASVLEVELAVIAPLPGCAR
jgi:hypothetical protein